MHLEPSNEGTSNACDHMPISFDSVVRVVQTDDSVVERAMNVDGTYYDFDVNAITNVDQSEASLGDFFDAVEESPPTPADGAGSNVQNDGNEGSYFMEFTGYDT